MSEPKLPEEYAPRTMTAVQWGQCCAIVTKATHKTQWQSALLMVFAELASVRAALAREGLAAEVALAASQARIAELREALASAKADIVCWLRAYGSETHSQAVAEVERAEYALGRPDDASALREMLTKAVDGGFDEGTAWMTRSGEMSSATRRAAIVQRVLGGE